MMSMHLTHVLIMFYTTTDYRLFGKLPKRKAGEHDDLGTEFRFRY